jgi:hypothetical protein
VRDNGTGGTTGSAFGGLFFGGSGEVGKMIAFNLTVVSNKARSSASGAAGIGCAAPPTALTNTVFFDNVGGFEIIAADCAPSFSAFKGAMASNNNRNLDSCTAAGLFTDPATFKFVPKAGAAPCTLIDAGTNTGAPNHDLAGTARPQPSSGTVDIGAFEAK